MKQKMVTGTPANLEELHYTEYDGDTFQNKILKEA